MTESVLLAVHLLGVVIWVGGMAFALLVLRPSLHVLQPPQRLALHAEVFAHFFHLVWHAMPLVLLSGYGLVFTVFGGFAEAGGAVHGMHAIGLLMALVFAWIYFVPWKAMRVATTDGDAAAAGAAVGRIRHLIWVNLGLGVLTVVMASFT